MNSQVSAPHANHSATSQCLRRTMKLVRGSLLSMKRGTRRAFLREFLRTCLNNDMRNVTAMRNYFSQRNIVYFPFGDENPSYTYASRQQYFEAIPDNSLGAGVVFFDPDIGLSSGSESYMRRVGPDKYLHDDELRAVSGRTSVDTISVLYQHLQRDQNRIWPDIEKRCDRFARELNVPGVSFVSDRDVVFIASSRDQPTRLSAAMTMVKYAHTHSLECGEFLAKVRIQSKR